MYESSGGAHIVFAALHPSGYTFDLFVMNADGTGVTALTTECRTTPSHLGRGRPSPRSLVAGGPRRSNACSRLFMDEQAAVSV